MQKDGRIKPLPRYYALAVINRSHAATVLRERINSLDAEAKVFSGQPKKQ